MTSLETLIAQLKEAAAKATPGLYACNSNGEVIAESRTLPSMQVIAKCENIGASDDAKLFALCSPENVLKLCAALEEAREAMIEIRGNYCTESGYYSCGAPCKDEARAWLKKYGSSN